MSQFPQLTSNLSTANFRASVLTKLISGIEISNDSGNPIPVTISGSSGATDYELVVSTYTCKTAFVGASVGDIITQTQVIGITAGVASTLTTIWRNQTTAIDLVSAPSSANLSLDGTTALTQAQLQAMTVAATQSGTWSVGVNNFPASTEISNDVGNPVPVSGSVSVSNFPASTEISNDVGNPIPVSGSVNPDVSGTTGTLVGNSTYTISTTNYSTLGFQAVPSGTISAGTVTIYGSVDGVTFTVLTTYVSLTTGGSSTTFAATNAITAGQINCTALKAIRFVSSAFTGGGSLAFTTNLSYNTSNVMLDNSVPVGSNLIGKINPTDGNGNLITIKAASTASSATDTSTVVALSPNSPLPVGSNAIGSVSVSNFPSSTEISNDIGNPIPVSGTVSASNTAFIATRPTGAVTASGGTVNSGTPVALTGSFTKMLVVQNTSTTGTLYVSTNAIPSATNGISLSAGVGYEFLHIPSSVIYVSASVGAITYGYIYA